MKRTAIFSHLFFVLLTGQLLAQSGLKGEYYTGTNFERKVLTRTDPQIQFNWAEGSPAAGMPHSYFSIRWTGKLLVPIAGLYQFYAKVDDGIRVWVDNQKVMDSWRLNDSRNFSGNIVLEAGRYYDLRVDYFNDMLEGEITLYWQRPDPKGTPRSKPIFEPITGQYFYQRKPLPAALPKPKLINPKPLPPARRNEVTKAPAVLAKPVTKPSPITRPLERPRLDSTTTSVPAKPVSLPPAGPVFTRGSTFVLRHVQFEQSSYSLLPESSVELNQVVAVMKANADWQIEVAGHTDNVGDPRLNQALSENRAKVVATYLIRSGLSDNRITTKGYGGTRPIADNALDTERPKNRRVEITIR